MTWGPIYFYYHCPVCNIKFKYSLDTMSAFGSAFGICPKCGTRGVYESDGPSIPDDSEYTEVEENE